MRDGMQKAIDEIREVNAWQRCDAGSHSESERAGMLQSARGKVELRRCLNCRVFFVGHTDEADESQAAKRDLIDASRKLAAEVEGGALEHATAGVVSMRASIACGLARTIRTLAGLLEQEMNR